MSGPVSRKGALGSGLLTQLPRDSWAPPAAVLSAGRWGAGLGCAVPTAQPGDAGALRPPPALRKWLPLHSRAGLTQEGPPEERGFKVLHLYNRVHTSGQWLATWSPTFLHRLMIPTHHLQEALSPCQQLMASRPAHSLCALSVNPKSPAGAGSARQGQGAAPPGTGPGACGRPAGQDPRPASSPHSHLDRRGHGGSERLGASPGHKAGAVLPLDRHSQLSPLQAPKTMATAPEARLSPQTVRPSRLATRPGQRPSPPQPLPRCRAMIWNWKGAEVQAGNLRPDPVTCLACVTAQLGGSLWLHATQPRRRRHAYPCCTMAPLDSEPAPSSPPLPLRAPSTFHTAPSSRPGALGQARHGGTGWPQTPAQGSVEGQAGKGHV